MSKRMTQREKVETIIATMDENRICEYGGYPSDWYIEGRKLFMATLDHNERPELVVVPVKEFIEKHDWALEN